MRAVEKKKQPIFFGYVQANSTNGAIRINSRDKTIVPLKTWIEHTANSNDRKQFARLYHLNGLSPHGCSPHCIWCCSLGRGIWCRCFWPRVGSCYSVIFSGRKCALEMWLLVPSRLLSDVKEKLSYFSLDFDTEMKAASESSGKERRTTYQMAT